MYTVFQLETFFFFVKKFKFTKTEMKTILTLIKEFKDKKSDLTSENLPSLLQYK